VHLNDDDISAFAAGGVGVAHCPTSNLRLGAGIARLRELLDAHVRVGLGVDGSASNERGDLSLEVKEALLVARARGGPGALTAREALRLGTRGGAEVLRRDDIGSLEPGKSADFAIWADEWIFSGAEDPVAALVFGGPRTVSGLVVRGRPVFENALDREIVRDHRKAASRFTS
jgi:cytosine/adenosine deaminase-related metal-dependent hydrolase